MDYLVLDNKKITSYNIYSNNSISFYKKLLQGLYYITIYRKKINISEIIENDTSIINSLRISILVEIKLNSLSEIFCNLESDIQIPISINFNDDILFNVKFYKYTISHLCFLLPSSFPIIISIYGDKDEKFIVNYSGETLPFTLNSEEHFIFQI